MVMASSADLVDELQYFNKKQQQSLLEFIEDGRITLIASTTENPYFYVYPAVLSRSAVFEFKPLSREALTGALERAVRVLEEEDGRKIGRKDGCILSLYDSICHRDRPCFCEYFQRCIPGSGGFRTGV